MKLDFDHEFTVPAPIEQTWSVLLDPRRVAPCVPGASLDSTDEGSGRLRVRIGRTTVTYRGDARCDEANDESRTLTLKAKGAEARGSGTASATVRARLAGADGQTTVSLHADVTVTGRPTQFDREVLRGAGVRLLDGFGSRLAETVASAEPAESNAGTTGATAAEQPGEPSRPAGFRPAGDSPAGDNEETIDLLDVTGMSMLKRLLPVGAGLAVVVVIWRVIARRRR